MAGILTKLNALPYDFITPGITGVNATTGSLVQTSSSGDKLLMAYDTANKVLMVGHGGTALTYNPSLIYKYNFAVEGGAVGAITLRGPVIPANFVITEVQYYVNTAITSGGSATVSIGAASAADILAATAIGTMGTTGSKATIPIQATVATHVLISTAVTPTITVAVAALTAGAFTMRINGYVSTTDATTIG